MPEQTEYYTSGGYLASDTISAAGGVLIQVTGLNPTGNDAFFLLFDVLPAPGTVPVQSIFVPSGANFSWVPSAGYAASVLAWGISSTGDAYTASVDAWWVAAQLVAQ